MGNTTEKEGTLANARPDIIEMRVPASNDPLYLSLNIDHIDLKGNGKMEPRIRITTLEKVAQQ